MDGDAAAARLEAESLEVGALGAANLTVSAELLVGRAAAGLVSTGTADVSGRLEGAGLRTSGSLTAETLAVAGAATIGGPMSARAVAGEVLTVSDSLSADRIAATGLHGPDAEVDAMTVGTCGGC